MPIWKHLNDLYGFCAKPNFLAAGHHTIIFPLHISQLFVYCKSTNYFTTGNRLNICLICKKNCMTTSNRLFGNLSTIYMATVQSPIFWLLRIYHFATAHLPSIYLLQIDQLFHNWESSKYLITVHWKILTTSNRLFRNISTINMATARSPILWPLRIHNFATAHLPIIYVLQIDKLFHDWKSST